MMSLKNKHLRSIPYFIESCEIIQDWPPCIRWCSRCCRWRIWQSVAWWWATSFLRLRQCCSHHYFHKPWQCRTTQLVQQFQMSVPEVNFECKKDSFTKSRETYHFVGSRAIISKGNVVVVSGHEAVEDDLVFGIVSGEWILIEGCSTSHCQRWNSSSCWSSLEGSGHTLEGLEVDKVASSLLIFQRLEKFLRSSQRLRLGEVCSRVGIGNWMNHRMYWVQRIVLRIGSSCPNQNEQSKPTA